MSSHHPVSGVGRIFLRAGVYSVSSLSLVGILKRDLLHEQALSEAEIETAYATSQLTPGTNFLAVAAATGWQLARLRGAIIAVIATSLPAAAVLTIFTQLHQMIHPAAATRGAVAAAVGVVAWTVWQLLPAARGIFLRIVFVLAFFASVFHVVSPVATLGLAALAGAVKPRSQK